MPCFDTTESSTITNVGISKRRAINPLHLGAGDPAPPLDMLSEVLYHIRHLFPCKSVRNLFQSGSLCPGHDCRVKFVFRPSKSLHFHKWYTWFFFLHKLLCYVIRFPYVCRVVVFIPEHPGAVRAKIPNSRTVADVCDLQT